jgi:basic membrane protein A and related proteins
MEEKIMMKKGLILVLAIFAAIALVGCGKTADEKEVLKVAVALTGARTDGGWNQSAYEGLVRIEKELGAEISFNENTQAADYEKILREYAKAGNNVVIGHGFQFSDGALKVGEEFPDVTFIVTSTNVTNNKNVGSLNNNYLQAGFLKGALAAYMTKTNVVGGIGGADIPPIQNDMKGYVAGAKYVNPDIKVVTAITGDGTDANKAKEQALTFVGQGADILMANANAASRGVHLAAEEKGIYSLASIAAEYDTFNKGLIACSIADMAKAIFQAVESIDQGTYEAKFQLMGIKEGIVDLTYSPTLKSKISAEILDKVADLRAKLLSGEIDVTKLVQ